jgi:hypothetical protein
LLRPSSEEDKTSDKEGGKSTGDYTASAHHSSEYASDRYLFLCVLCEFICALCNLISVTIIVLNTRATGTQKHVSECFVSVCAVQVDLCHRHSSECASDRYLFLCVLCKCICVLCNLISVTVIVSVPALAALLPISE